MCRAIGAQTNTIGIGNAHTFWLYAVLNFLFIGFTWAFVPETRGVTLGADNVVIVEGTRAALALISDILIDPGDAVAVEDPGYGAIREAVAASGGNVVPVPLDGEGFDVARAPRTARFAYVTPSHQYPTGVVMGLRRRLDLLAPREFRIADLGGGGDIAADPDQVAAQGKVVDHPRVVGGVGGRRGAVDHVGQVADAAQVLERGVALELFSQQDRLGQVASAHMGLDGGVQPAVERLEEVRRLEGVAQPLIGGVVIEQHA